MDWFAIFDRAARTRHSLPERWRGSLYTRSGLSPAFLGLTITGAVYDRDWDRRDRGTERTVFVSAAEIEAARDPHPRASGAVPDGGR